MKIGTSVSMRMLAMLALVVPLSGLANETIHVELADDSIRLDTETAKAGHVTFEVNNRATSNTVHEFVVLRTDTDEARLPVHNGQVTESRFRKMGEVENLQRDSVKRLSLNLSPGRYVLICNRPGHYAMGMHKSLLIVH
ncbi:hypothetical protein AWB78_05754 [Caballeronia calidae]|uniref:EfeO-type cupredoxin-like domain-containing protein n=1 Tax=Caballeronia calidae TaxID=1777139 RepID=A0A158DX85_9BURK|nr:hypothetical protein [Caballeronia calidae]SAK99251.1 hypothetical protein AWB78_05754 [Caballeronia calidae]